MNVRKISGTTNFGEQKHTYHGKVSNRQTIINHYNVSQYYGNHGNAGRKGPVQGRKCVF